MRRAGTIRLAVAAIAALALLGVACSGARSGGGGTGPSAESPTPAAPRPASTAKLGIVSPKNGQIVHGTTVTLKISLEHAKIVPMTTTDIVPDEGHLHVILDDQLVSMTGRTQQVLTNLSPGQHLLKVEFVASDHSPFDPRVIAAVAFEVRA